MKIINFEKKKKRIYQQGKDLYRYAKISYICKE